MLGAIGAVLYCKYCNIFYRCRRSVVPSTTSFGLSLFELVQDEVQAVTVALHLASIVIIKSFEVVLIAVRRQEELEIRFVHWYST